LWFMKVWDMDIYCVGGKIEKNDMGGACDAYWTRGRGVQGSGGET